MKKVLATVAAASIVAAGAPAFAADVDLSGQVRVRYEQKNNFTDLDNDTGDVSDNTSQRTRLSASVKIDDQTSAKITLNDARYYGESGTTNDAADIVLNEGYLKIDNAIGPVSIKVNNADMFRIHFFQNTAQYFIIFYFQNNIHTGKLTNFIIIRGCKHALLLSILDPFHLGQSVCNHQNLKVHFF